MVNRIWAQWSNRVLTQEDLGRGGRPTPPAPIRVDKEEKEEEEEEEEEEEPPPVYDCA